jgi:hypothetical protein
MTASASLSEHYACAIADAYHWVLVALVGENMAPATSTERMISSVIILTGHLVNSVVIGSCASLLLNMDHNAVLRQQQKEIINGVMSYHRVPEILASRIRNFYGMALAHAATIPWTNPAITYS